MTAVLAERPRTVTPPSLAAVGSPAPVTSPPDLVDRDGVEVYCPEAEAWSRTRELFCESCGATDHDLR